MRSYVVGFGNNLPRNPHHRTSHGTPRHTIKDPPTNRDTLCGTLGGPTSPDDSPYVDDRANFEANKVALDYNAGLTGVVATMTLELSEPP